MQYLFYRKLIIIKLTLTYILIKKININLKKNLKSKNNLNIN